MGHQEIDSRKHLSLEGSRCLRETGIANEMSERHLVTLCLNLFRIFFVEPGDYKMSFRHTLGKSFVP